MYLLHGDAQKWYYLSKQQPDEVTLFKNFDSSVTVGAIRKFERLISMKGPQAKASPQGAPHSSFLSDSASPEAKPRESIEVRALVFGGEG